jgi:ribosome maturation factor RimP
MALDVDQIRATAQRVAASHGLDVVDLEFHGGAKHRILRVFIEKNAVERKRLSEEIPADAVPVAAEQLSGITHTDCEVFSRDFGTVVDIEDLVPGAEYTLEVSSPGLDRKLHGRDDFQRFTGLLTKLQTFEPVAGNRHWQGKITEVNEQSIRLDVSGTKQKARSRPPENSSVEITLANIEKAQLVPEF